MWSNERSAMNVTVLVGSRPFRLHVKNKWLEASVEALVARVLAKHGGGLAVEDCCVTVGGAAASGRAADVLREGGVVEVWRARVVVCTMVTASFCRVFELWLSRFLAATDDRCQLVVCCLDDVAERLVGSLTARSGRPARVLGVRDGFRPPSTRADLWNERLGFVERLVLEESASSTPRDVVHSDCDAFWLGDARRLVDGGRDGPAARFSVDHGLGRGAKPFALCCGFFRLAPSAASLALLRAWRPLTATIGDDQVAANVLYDRDAAEFDTVAYERVQRCNCHHATTDLPVVWHPWLDATVDDKLYVWSRVLDGLRRGDAALLRAFYARRPAVSLTRAALDGLLAAAVDEVS